MKLLTQRDIERQKRAMRLLREDLKHANAKNADLAAERVQMIRMNDRLTAEVQKLTSALQTATSGLRDAHRDNVRLRKRVAELEVDGE